MNAKRNASPGQTPHLPLFREEAVKARQQQAFGTVVLIQPLSAKVLTLAALVVTAGLIALLFKGEYTRKAHVEGFVVPASGLIKVYSLEVGTVVDKRVSEGQSVSRGDVLFIVSMERRSSDAEEAQASAIAELRGRRSSLQAELVQQARLSQLAARALNQRIDAMQAEIDQLSKELVTQERRVAGAESIMRRYQELGERSLASAEVVEEKQKDVLDQQGRLQALQRDRLALMRERQALRSELPSTDLRGATQRAAIERDISSLEQQRTEYESRRTFVVTAPSDGIATAVLTDRGFTTNPSQPLVSILPAGSAMEAHLLVPTRAIGFLVPGQTVTLRYDAFPYQRFGSYSGRIGAISKTLILPNETSSLPFQPTEAVYRVTVLLDSPSVKAYGQEYPLQVGMQLDADIWLDRRKLYEWLLDPLYSVMGRV